MTPHLLLRLEAPLMAFGTVQVDQHGPIGDFPCPSALTGLIANALGWRRTDVDRLQRLQERLVFAVRRDREGERIQDFQTAQLGKSDRGWTTRGGPEKRGGGPETYDSPHIRYRWYDADCALTVALRLEPAEEDPRLESVAAALDRPARPLFFGRKPCLPASRLVLGLVEASDCLAALAQALPAEGAANCPRLFWPDGEGPPGPPGASLLVHGLRRFAVDVHEGRQLWWQGTNPAPAAGR